MKKREPHTCPQCKSSLRSIYTKFCQNCGLKLLKKCPDCEEYMSVFTEHKCSSIVKSKRIASRKYRKSSQYKKLREFYAKCSESKKQSRDEGKKISRNISKNVQREVWRRDQGRCVECRSKERLEFDHIIPFSMGGSNTARNIQLLCEKCNRKKYNKIGP